MRPPRDVCEHIYICALALLCSATPPLPRMQLCPSVTSSAAPPAACTTSCEGLARDLLHMTPPPSHHQPPHPPSPWCACYLACHLHGSEPILSAYPVTARTVSTPSHSDGHHTMYMHPCSHVSPRRGKNLGAISAQSQRRPVRGLHVYVSSLRLPPVT